jgi:signal transduction histidine kinase
VKAKRLNGEMIVSISDTGTGIDPLIFPKLFRKFTSTSALDYGDGGTGLGLYISKSIIEAHNGRIWAENNSDGRGATFSFSLPLDNYIYYLLVLYHRNRFCESRIDSLAFEVNMYHP